MMVLNVIAFYILTLLFTVLLGGLQQATGFLPYLSIPQFGPAIAALVTLLAFKKSRFKLNFSLRSIPLKALVLNILVPAFAAAILLLFKGMWSESSPDQTLLPALAYIWIPFGALGEEIGWRGYLHRRLDQKFSGLASCLIVGLLWTLFHVHLYGNGILYMVFLAVVIVSYTFVLFVAMKWTHFNIWVATLFHTAVNVANLLFMDSLNQNRFMMFNALVWAVIAVIVFIIFRSTFLEKPGD